MAPIDNRFAGAERLPWQALALAVICGACGLLAWGFYLWVFRADPGQDWMVFYTAARAYFDGNLPLIFDGESLTAALNQRFAAWLGFTLNLHPWVYPPTFLLLFLPFGMLPPSVSLAAFLLSGFLALLAAAALYAGRGRPRWILAFSLVLCPAVPFNVMTGQNAFFTGALLVGGFGLIGRSPVLAGALLGLLSFKPQLWLMVPVALIAARQWRALGSAAASALALALVSLAVFGPDIWRAWLALVSGMDAAYSAWLVNGRLNGLSVFACVTWLGMPRAVANLAQGVAVALAAVLVYRVFRRPGPPPYPPPLSPHPSLPRKRGRGREGAGEGREGVGALHLAVLLAATMLAAPHASASDAVLLALATGLFVAAPRSDRLRPADLALAAALWISPLLNPPSVFRPGSLTPVLILLFIGSVIAAMRRHGRDIGDPASARRAGRA